MMARLRNRLIPVDWLNDGRLLSVSPAARALALVLEHMAEDTGCVAENLMEIRSLGGQYLADIEGRQPTADEIKTLLDELAGVTWALRYTHDDVPLIYLKGFGERQQGPSVGIGVSKASGEIAAHLPTPQCVDLDSASEQWRKANRVRPVHCERSYLACPMCQQEASHKPTDCQVQQSQSQARKESQAEALPESESEEEAKAKGVQGDEDCETLPAGPVLIEERITAASERLGRTRTLKAYKDLHAHLSKTGKEKTPELVLFFLEAEEERDDALTP